VSRLPDTTLASRVRGWTGDGGSPSVAAGEVVGLAVTVGAQQLEIVEPVVVANAVDVMQSEGDRLSTPILQAARLTAIAF